MHILQARFHNNGVKLHDNVPSREAVAAGRSTTLEILSSPEAAAVNKIAIFYVSDGTDAMIW